MAAAAQQGMRRPSEAVPGTRCSTDAAALNRRSQPNLSSATPVHQTGCFEFDRIIKSGHVQKRTRKTKNWKSVFLVLRANAISLYKNDKENKLRHQIYLADLSAVTFLKDPKGKRKNLFGLFSSSRNFHFEAPTPQDAQEWVDLIRTEARLEEEEEEMLLNGPVRRSISPGRPAMVQPGSLGHMLDNSDHLNALSSSAENHLLFGAPNPNYMSAGHRRMSSTLESSGLSGNEMPSYSDWSDVETSKIRGPSRENLATHYSAVGSLPQHLQHLALPGQQRLDTAGRTASQIEAATTEQESERVVWQGWLWRLQSKGGVRQWKHMWGVLRGRSLVLYKNESEYSAQWIVDVSDVVDVVEIDPLSKHKTKCFQIITEERTFRFCAHDEESLVRFIGAFKGLLAKRRSLGARAAAAKALL